MQKSGISLLSIWFHTIAVENSIQIVCRGEKNIVMTEKEKFLKKKEIK